MTLTPDVEGQILPEPAASGSSPVRVGTLLKRIHPTPDTIVLFLALLIGTGAGAGVVLFRYLIRVVNQLMLGQLSGVLSIWGHWTLALIPILGGLLVGLLRWAANGFGPGLSAMIELVQGGRELLPLKPISKMLAAALSLGSGASLGPEGPSVEIGASFSLLLGQALRVSQERQQLLLGAGAAAGLAAGFNAPIAGVFFALEVVLGTMFATSAASVVLLASVVAAWIAQIGLGAEPAFALPAYEVRSLLELPLYLGLGLLASFVSIFYKQSMGFAQKSFQGQVPGVQWLATIPPPLQPVLGGLCVGAIALQFPQILGVGYETVESILQDVQFPLYLVLALLAVKLVMTAISFGSGFVGGVFAPALFLGAALGSAYGKVLASALPMLHDYMASPPAYAMVGMAAVLAGSVRAPLTAILLLFELTQDYRIVLPLMSAVGLSVWLVEKLQPTVLLDSDGEQQDGSGEKIAGMIVPSTLLVYEAIQPISLQLAGDVSLEEAGQALIQSQSHCTLVMDQDSLVGILTLRDVNRLISKPSDRLQTIELLHQPIRSLCTTEMLYAYPDELLTEAIARMSARGLHQMPVVEREQPDHVIGLLTQESIILASSIDRLSKTLQSSTESHSIDEPSTQPANC